MRFHCPGLPHTEITADYCACAYTSKVRKFAKMMTARGHEVLLYGGERCDAPCTEHVTIVSASERKSWHAGPPEAVNWDGNLPMWALSNGRAAREIRKRARPGDFLCIIGGYAQKAIADALPDLTACEYGIGYEGTFAKHRCFESHAWRHYVHGKDRESDGRGLDCVIPNYFDAEEFPAGDGSGGYFLFIGRLIKRKGPEIAVEATRRLGVPILIAGSGIRHCEPGLIATQDGTTLHGEHIRYVGTVGVQKRAELMGNALAAFVPTQYLEPFGGVAVEAMMCGTPVITSDFGAFPETVEQGVTGFRCGTIAEYAAAARLAAELNRPAIRHRAIERFSLDAVAPQYERWFGRLATNATEEA